ncbi:Integral membrane protein [Alternaria alternata]|nr:Integral membrane protein [Alternaria alternata]
MAPQNTDPARAAESNLGYLLGVTATFHVVALVFVAMRLYARVIIVKAFGKDDALIIASTVCVFLGGMVTYILAAQHGLGRHTDTLEKEDHHEYLKLTFIQAIVSTIGGMAFLKLSVGFSLLRLKVPTLYTRMLWSLIVVSWGEWAAVCKPIAGFWNKDLKPTCLAVNIHKGFALMNTIIMGIVKTVVQNTKRGDPDQSFTNDIQFWGFLQVNIGIIAACAPSLKPIVGGILHLPSTQQSKTRSNFATGSNSHPNKSRIQSRIRIQSKGWMRTDSEIELDGAESFGSETHITSNKDDRSGSH